jgi:hypothetical protein
MLLEICELLGALLIITGLASTTSRSSSITTGLIFQARDLDILIAVVLVH